MFAPFCLILTVLFCGALACVFGFIAWVGLMGVKDSLTEWWKERSL